MSDYLCEAAQHGSENVSHFTGWHFILKTQFEINESVVLQEHVTGRRHFRMSLKLRISASVLNRFSGCEGQAWGQTNMILFARFGKKAFLLIGMGFKM